MHVHFQKRYPGNRYEYFVSIAYKISPNSPRLDQERKLDIFKLFKKGNQIIAEKNSNPELVGPLFSPINLPNQWFWSKKSIRIIENNTHMSNDHIINFISYIAPLPFNAYMYAEFDTTNEKTYKICTLGECKLYREHSTSSGENKKVLIDNNPYNTYYLFKLPPGKKLVFTAETEFSIPYVYKDEYDIDAQLEVKEVILFDVIDKTMLKCNPDQKFIYTDLEIERKNVTNNFQKTSNTCAKFRRPHILPILPSIKDDPLIYKLMNISEDTYNLYHDRIKYENDMFHQSPDTHITVTFSVIGSSVYTVKFLHDALVNLRRNLTQFTFNDKTFIAELITNIIERLDKFNH